MSNFVETLTELLIEKNLSQKEFAEKLEITSTAVSKYLLGKQNPDVEIAIRIAEYFNCSLDYLFGKEYDNHIKSFHACPPFNERFVFLIKHFKISKYKLQKSTGISKSTMHYWQNGEREPSMDSIIKLAKCFDCSIDFVLGRVDFE